MSQERDYFRAGFKERDQTRSEAPGLQAELELTACYLSPISYKAIMKWASHL